MISVAGPGCRSSASISWGILGTLGVALALLLPAPAAANVYVSSYTFSMPEPVNWWDTVAIDRFNETLTDPLHLDPNNNLVRVDLVFQATFSGALMVTNANAVPQTVDVVFGTNVAVSGTLLTGQVIDADPTYRSTVAVPASSSVFLTTPRPSGTDSSAYTSVNSTDLAAFSGSGSITATIAPTTAQANWLTFPEPTGGWGKQPPTGSFSGPAITGTLWVYYHTPEPGALVLLSLGLAAGLCRRSRRQD
jgi:hypothetical protein